MLLYKWSHRLWRTHIKYMHTTSNNFEFGQLPLKMIVMITTETRILD